MATLRQDVVPNISDDGVRIKIDHVTRVLLAVEARLSKREAGLREFIAGAGPLTGAAEGAPDADLATLEQLRRATEEVICTRSPEMLRSAALSQAGVDKLRDVLAFERQFFVSQDADVAKGSAIVYRGGRIDGEAPSPSADAQAVIDATTLTRYMRARTGDDGVTVSAVRKVPGGFSKETVFFTVNDAVHGPPQDLVMRKDLPTPLIEKMVANEFGLLTKLFESGFPVAEPLWLETDATLFSGGFIVSRRVAGTSDVAQWANDPAGVRTACLDLARLLATLHAFAPVQLGFDPSTATLSAGEAMAQEIVHWTRLFHAKRREAFPLQELPLVWLAQNIPSALFERPARVVHGDFGFHNLMMDETGRVTAVLDWEFAGLGDPSQDLVFVRQFVEGFMPWPEFLAAYREAGGPAPCDEAEFFYHLWTMARNGVGCVDAQALFDTVMPGEMRFALAGHVFAPYMFVDQCETLIEHLAKSRP
jgi:aminoglycoside phosphotransferase (APT) family kinase protein